MKYKIINHSSKDKIAEVKIESRPRSSEQLLIKRKLYNIVNIIHNEEMTILTVSESENGNELETEWN